VLKALRNLSRLQTTVLSVTLPGKVTEVV
jgi:hypothetical protein